MQSRQFGNTDLVVSAVGLGCARIGGLFESAGHKATLHLLERAVDEGITLFDTADMYAQGESERLVGQALRPRRDQVVIATKFGYLLPGQQRWTSRVKPLLKPLVTRLGLRGRFISIAGQSQPRHQDFSPAYIVAAVEASLRRLKTDYVDIYQLHSPSSEVLMRGDFVKPLERLREQGKIRYWGVACEDASDVMTALQLAPLRAVQVGVSALEQDALDSAIPMASSLGVGIIGRQVFASGLLTRPLEGIEPRFIDTQTKRYRLMQYAKLVEKTGRSRAEMAVQYALSIEGLSVVLAGVSRIAQLDEVLRAWHAPRLTREERDLVTLSRGSAPIT
jgi:aryl-alcohol dehydrogenase-like predicted oxidoreductase